MANIVSVSELTRGIRHSLEKTFPFVWVRGQIANLSRPASGHIYFSLKDDEASLACVWFRTAQRGTETFDPLTGEVFEEEPRFGTAATIQNGQELLCAGRISVYGQRGIYQLVVELAREAGKGELYARFEALKQKLAALGWFEARRKRPLPSLPRRVALVTSATGAAVHDFIHIASGRGCGCDLRIYPALVQGEEAPLSLVTAIKLVTEQGWAELVVLIRGGGSQEDLWAFNDERVAQAIYESPLPGLAGVGHEVDTTIADMVADVRAATPSHAAQLLWPARYELVQRVDDVELALQRVWAKYIQQREQDFELRARALAWLSPARALARQEDRLWAVTKRLEYAANVWIKCRDGEFKALVAELKRVYGLFALDAKDLRLQQLANRLARARAAADTLAEQALEHMTLRLKGVDPLAPLHRGYSLVQQRDGSVVRSLADATTGDTLCITVHDGRLDVHVDALHPMDNIRSLPVEHTHEVPAQHGRKGVE